MLPRISLICVCVSVLAPRLVHSFGFFAEFWTWFTYNFRWSDKFDWFDDHVCELPNTTTHTFYFGGKRTKGKLSWVIGSNLWNIGGSLKDWANIIDWVDARGQTHTKNAAGIRLPREGLMPLMIGSDYFEPCVWLDKVPKIISYKVSKPPTVKVYLGEFDVFVGKGHEECGKGRVSYLGAWPSDSNAQSDWVKKATTYGFHWDPDHTKRQPLATLNTGGLFSGNPGGLEQANGRYFTSAVFDPAIVEQVICLVFYCYNPEAPCAVQVEHWQVSDIAGDAYEAQEGTAFWNMTPMDLFALAMTVFCPIFFCIQCCCCCQICAHECRGGVVDTQAVLEAQVKQQQAAAGRGGAGSARSRPAPRNSPRHARYQRSPRRAR